MITTRRTAEFWSPCQGDATDLASPLARFTDGTVALHPPMRRALRPKPQKRPLAMARAFCDTLATIGRVTLVTLSLAAPMAAAEIPDQPAFVVDPPLSAAESLKKLHLPAGFVAEIVAAEPLVLDPVSFDGDDRGRLWVAEMADYPMGMDGRGKPGGRIRVLEDTDRDGRYDRQTVFAEGLNFPNGILAWRDGVIVTAAPHVIFLRDTDGDGKADKQGILLSGLQERNQQLRANGLRWGLDNWVYVASGGHHGKYGSNTRLKSTRSGQDVLVGARDFRFRPDSGELEPQSGPTQFGRSRDNWGRWFGTQNAHPLWHYVLAEHYLARNPHFGVNETRVHLLTSPSSPPVYPASVEPNRYHDFGSLGHYTSACSGLIYRDRLMFGPDRYDALVCEPVHNLVQHLVLAENGVSFSAKQELDGGKYDFFASEDRWCRPVMVRESAGRRAVDCGHRSLYDRASAMAAADGQGGIAAALSSRRRARTPLSREPHRDDRLQAGAFRSARHARSGRRARGHKRLVPGQGAPDSAMARRPGRADPLLTMAGQSPNPLARLHALCVLDGLGKLPPAAVIRALGDASPAIRENALRLAETRFTPDLLAAAARLANDPDAKVRLQLAFTLGASLDAVAGKTLGRLLSAHADDPMMVAAVMSPATPHLRALVAAAANLRLDTLTDALRATALGLNDHEAIASLVAPIFSTNGTRYSPEKLGSFARFLEQLRQSGNTLDQLLGAAASDALGRLLSRAEAITAQVRLTASDAAVPAGERIAAAALLSRSPARQAEAVPLLAAWLDPKHPTEDQAAAIRALSAIVTSEVPAAFAKAWPTMSPGTRKLALGAWMGREPWAFDLVRRLERKELADSAIDTTVRARLLKHDPKRISQLAGRVFDASSSARRKVVESYRPALALPGDPGKGHHVFTAVCAACHQRGPDGRDVGPDLVSVVDHQPEKLLGSILDPSAEIQPGFNAYTCTLNPGEQIYGLLASESATSVAMKLVDGTIRTVRRNEIATLQSHDVSLMPEGLEGAVDRQAMADLIAYLRQHLTGGSR